MKMDLKARYQTMDEVVADLEDYQVTRRSGRGRGQGTSPGSTDPDAVEEPRRRTSSSS